MLKRITNLYKIIVWVLLAGSLFAQSKEGLYSTDKNLIFRETFNSEYDCRRNGGTPTDVSFNQGKATFNNTSSFINYGDRLNFGLNSFSVKAKARSIALNETGTILAKRAATNNSVGFWITQNNASTLRYSIEIDDGLGNEVLCTSDAITGNEDWHELVFVVDRTLNLSYVYVDGSSVVSADISSVGSINNSVDLLISKIGASGFFAGDLDAVKVYNYALTANEVLNLYQNKRYREFTSPNEILRVDARNGAIENKYAGDSYGSDLLSGWDFTSGWTAAGTGSIVDSDSFSSSVAGGIYKNTGINTVGKKYKVHIKGTTTASTFQFRNASDATIYKTISAGTFDEVFEYTATAAQIYLYNSAAGTTDITYMKTWEVIPSVTNTSTTIKRSGDIYAMDFDGATSKVDCGSYDALVGDKTFVMWLKPKTSTTSRILFANAKILMGITNTPQFYFSRDGSTSPLSTAVNFNKWICWIVTSTSSGVTNHYADGALASVTPNQSAGTPVAGTTNMIIGFGDGKYTNGQIDDFRIIDGLLTAQEIAQIYTSEKSQYGK